LKPQGTDEEVDFKSDIGDTKDIFVLDGKFTHIQKCRWDSLEEAPETSDHPLNDD
jgi:hypothetical protein